MGPAGRLYSLAGKFVKRGSVGPGTHSSELRGGRQLDECLHHPGRSVLARHGRDGQTKLHHGSARHRTDGYQLDLSCYQPGAAWLVQRAEQCTRDIGAGERHVVDLTATQTV